MHELLAIAWFFLLGLILLIYVATDGFDLGGGILCLFTGNENERDQIHAAIDQIWDFHEGWLVILGGAMYGAFPSAFTTLMDALYFPLIVMLAFFILRLACIEFRKVLGHKVLWDVSFVLCSLGAAVCQGFMLGRAITGLFFGSAAAFCIFAVIVAVIASYILLGSTFLMDKVRGARTTTLRNQAFVTLGAASLCALILPAAAKLSTSINDMRESTTISWGIQIPLAMLVIATGAFTCRALLLKSSRTAFQGAIALCGASLLAAALSVFPDLVPGRIAIHNAANSTFALASMLGGIAVLAPIMLGYSRFRHRVLRHQKDGAR